jgi:hypothetical protein
MNSSYHIFKKENINEREKYNWLLGGLMTVLGEDLDYSRSES